MERRERYSKLLRRADRLGSSLATLSGPVLQRMGNEPSMLTVLRCLLGVRAWRAVKGVRRLMNLRIDDQVGVLARHLYELALTIEYVSTDTNRGPKEGVRLSSQEKVQLFREYYWVEMDNSRYASPRAEELADALARRKRLGIKDKQAWHGTSLLALCEELDKKALERKAPALRVDNYRGVYKSLSNMFIHPSFRGTPWLDLVSDQYLKVRLNWESSELLGIAGFYSAVVLGFWNEALGSPKSVVVRRLLTDAASLVGH